MIMLGTNICIYVLKERHIHVLQKFEQHDSLHISAIVYAELWSVVEKSPKQTTRVNLLVLKGWRLETGLNSHYGS